MSDGFDWKLYLKRPSFKAAPVSCFKHVALSNSWDGLVNNIYVEIRSPDCKTCCPSIPCRYWIASVIKVHGYIGLLHYVGFDSDSGRRWVNLCTDPHVHALGWCADNKRCLVPPKSIEDKCDNWSDYLLKKIAGVRTLPEDETFKGAEQSNNLIKSGMKLEVVDKNLISVVRPAIVSEVVGGRLRVTYDDDEEDDGFWCHERSPLIHPIGWAQIIGHGLKAKPGHSCTKCDEFSDKEELFLGICHYIRKCYICIFPLSNNVSFSLILSSEAN